MVGMSIFDSPCMISLLVGFASVLLSAVIGIVAGLAAGYIGGKVDAVIMRIADIQLSFPTILIALLIDGIMRGILDREQYEAMIIPVLVLSIGNLKLGAVCPDGAGLHTGGAEQGICAGGTDYWPASGPDHDPTCIAST